jgi:poly(A) polymerase
VSSAITPRIIPRSEHLVSPANITPSARKVLDGLAAAGFTGYLVGGCVRDLMLGREPKDFDVVTDATPEEVRKLFRNSRLVGRRFRLAHVRFGRDIIEVATFRALPDEAEAGGEHERTAGGRLLRDNVYGDREQDALRRDFTVNALYYDAGDQTVIDYVGGVDDLRNGVLKVIGDPATRYREDPVRMLRAIRFAAKLGFLLEEDTAAPIRGLASLLRDVPPARLFEEVLKLFHSGYALETYELLRNYGLFGHLFPLVEESLAEEDEGFPLTLLPKALANTDKRIGENKPVTPAFLFAALLWEPARRRMQEYIAAGDSEQAALERASREVIAAQLARVSIPRRFSVPMTEIWSMQLRLRNRQKRRVSQLAAHERFRAAYDFLLLRAECGEEDPALAEWWTKFQEIDAAGRETMTHALSDRGRGGRRRRRRRKKAPTPEQS